MDGSESVQEESIGLRQYSSNLNSRTKGFLWQSNSRVKGISFDKIVIFILLLIHYQFLMLFNVSDSFFLRLFTTDKVIYYLAIIVIMHQVLRRRFYVIRQIPGVWLLIPIVFSLAVSNYLATKSGVSIFGNFGGDRSVTLEALQFSSYSYSHWKVFWKEIGSILFMITTVLVLNSYFKIFLYLKWSLYFVVFLAFVSLLPLEVSDVLSNSLKTDVIQETISGQTNSLSHTDLSGNKRHHVLWMDANNYAFYLVPALLVLILIINYGQRIIRLPPHFVLFLLFGFLVANLLFTQSRGGLFCFLGGLTVLLYQYRAKFNRWVIPLMVFAFGFVVMFFYTDMSDVFKNLYYRFYNALSLFGDESARRNVTGMESNRVISSLFAIQDILEKPLLGWGSGFQVGRYSSTGNHVGYLNLIGKYGFIGVGLIILFFFNCLWSFLQSIRKNTYRNSFEHYLGFCLVAIYIALILSGFFRTFSPVEITPLAISFYLVSKYNTRWSEIS